MTGLPPSWSDLIWNNLRVTLILCGGLVSATLITLFFGSFSLFVTGASFGVAVSELGLLAVAKASPHLPLEVAALVVAGIVSTDRTGRLAGVFVLGRPNPSSGASAPAQALQAGSSHEHRHRIMSDRDPVAQSQLGVDPQRTIGAPVTVGRC